MSERVTELKARMQEYRNALDHLEMAVGALNLDDLVRRWGDPRHDPKLGVKLPTNTGTIYNIVDAMEEATRLMNEYGREFP